MDTTDLNSLLREAAQDATKPKDASEGDVLQEIVAGEQHRDAFEASATTTYVTIIDAPSPETIGETCQSDTSCLCASHERLDEAPAELR